MVAAAFVFTAVRLEESLPRTVAFGCGSDTGERRSVLVDPESTRFRILQREGLV